MLEPGRTAGAGLAVAALVALAGCGASPSTVATRDGASPPEERVELQPFTSAAQLPTDGEPYRLRVRSGSGAFAGATGTCEIDNVVVQPRPGVQDQSGPVTCDGTRA